MIEKTAFIKIVDEKSKTMYRIAWSILQNEMDCGDAMQECAIKAWSSRHKVRDDRYYSTWMIKILINECRNIQRKKRRFVFMADVEQAEKTAVPDIDLQNAIDSLPDKLRIPFVIHHIEGYSQSETANMLRIPLSTARDRLYRARKALRLELSTEEVY